MDIILKGISFTDLVYLRGALEGQIFHVHSDIEHARSASKLDSDVDTKKLHESYIDNLEDQLKSLNGLLDML